MSYVNPDELPLEQQVTLYKTKYEKLNHVNKELQINLSNEKRKHAETHELLECAMRNTMMMSLNFTQETSSHETFRQKFNW